MPRKRKPRPVPRKDGPDNKTVEIFGENKRFIPSEAKGPQIHSFKQTAAWENRVKNYTPREWRRIGNIQRCFHGTAMHNIAWIAIQSLQPGGRRGSIYRWRTGLFGQGIYVAPKSAKAFGYTKPYKWKNGGWCRYLLEGRVALGKVYRAKESGDCRVQLLDNGCDSVVAGAGMPINGVWGGSLINTEYVVYDPVQVVIDFVYEYEEIERKPVIARRYRRPTLPSWKSTKPSPHPCQKDDKRCKNSFHDSGCVVLNRKKGVTKEDLEYCQHFEV
jgi:hypothetical protein